MAVWVSLLRGINLPRHNKVNMPQLREGLAAAGFTDVRTVVQSGNVLTRSRHRSAEMVSAAVRAVVRERFGIEVPVIVRSPQQLREVLAWCPFPADAAERPKLVHVVHLAGEPDPDAVARLLATDWSPDGVAARGQEIVVRYGASMHDSPVQRAAALKAFSDATARNWRTLTSLVELTADD